MLKRKVEKNFLKAFKEKQTKMSDELVTALMEVLLDTLEKRRS